MKKSNLSVLKEYTIVSDKQLSQSSGGYWKNVWSVGPGVYQYNTKTHKYRYIQTTSNSQHLINTIVNGWAGAAAGGWKQ